LLGGPHFARLIVTEIRLLVPSGCETRENVLAKGEIAFVDFDGIEAFTTRSNSRARSNLQCKLLSVGLAMSPGWMISGARRLSKQFDEAMGGR
jgi:hypothetical protein